MKRIKRILCISLLSMFIFSLGYATKPSIPSLKMEMSIIHDGNWEAGKETKVTFTFRPLEDVEHKTTHPDEAQLYLDSGFVLVSGLPSWSGFLEKGKEYSISVVLRPTHGGKFVIGGGVKSSLSKIYTDEELRKKEEEHDKLIEQSPELKRMGMRAKYPKKTFFYHNGTSTVVDVQGEIPAPDTTGHETNIVTIRSLKDLGPPPTITEGLPIKVIRPETTIHSDSIRVDTTAVIRPR